MATNMVRAWTTSQYLEGAPALGSAGGNIGDAVQVGSSKGINLWGTGGTQNAVGIQRTGGVGVPVGSTGAVIAKDGTWKLTVTTGTAVTYGMPIYITSANAVTTTAAGNTLFGLADEPAANAATARIGVRLGAY